MWGWINYKDFFRESKWSYPQIFPFYYNLGTERIKKMIYNRSDSIEANILFQNHYVLSKIYNRAARKTKPLLMTSPNGNIWRGTLMFLWCAPEQTVERTVQMRVIWDAMALIVTLLWYDGGIIVLHGTIVRYYSVNREHSSSIQRVTIETIQFF